MSAPADLDLVLAAGGVKGIALAGAAAELGSTGVRLQRVAGVSAGAIVGAVVAALARSGETLSRVDDVLATLRLDTITDPGTAGRLFGWPGKALDVLLHDGVYQGRALDRWLSGVLDDLGVRTFGDLRLPADPGGDLPREHRYRLLVVAADVSDRRLVSFPWDYRTRYGRDPDEMNVSAAVRASAAIPYFFRPANLRTGDGGTATLVDGGLLTRFPLEVFDRTDGKAPRWPTFGVSLRRRRSTALRPDRVHGPVRLPITLVETMLDAGDTHLREEPCDIARTVHVDTGDVSSLDFGLDSAQQRALRDEGADAMRAFLARWNEPAYLRQCRGVTP